MAQLRQPRSAGLTWPTMSPYQQDTNVRRFGDFAYDLTTPLETMDVHLTLD